MKKYALRGHTGADNNCGGGSGGDTTYDTSRCGIPPQPAEPTAPPEREPALSVSLRLPAPPEGAP